MNWLNLNIQTLDSEEFIGSDPVSRATWICLLRYCIGQENGGRIDDCHGWADRKWQQLVRITKEEVEATSALWSWEGQDLVVWEYPTGKEVEVQSKRDGGRTGGQATSEAKTQAARVNGSKGGRPKTQAKTQASSEEEPNHKPNGKELERKGTEVEGEGRESTGTASDLAETKPFNPKRIATFEQVRKFGKAQLLPMSDECCEAFFDRMESEGWITPNGHPLADWQARFRSWATNWANNSASNGQRRAAK